MSTKIQITISGVLADLANGLTRTAKSPSYDSTKGSIQEKYNLSGVEVAQLFKHEKLRNKKVHVTKESSFELIDDTISTTAEVGAEVVEAEVQIEVQAEEVVETGEVVANQGWQA